MKAHPADHVLPHVNDRIASRSFQNSYGFEFLDFPHGRPCGSNQLGLWGIEQRYALPILVVVAGSAPACALHARVIRLAVVDVRKQDGARRRLPVFVRADDLLLAVSVGNHELGQQSQPRAIRIPPIIPSHISAEPAVPQQSTQAIHTRFQIRGDVVGLILIAKIVCGPARREVLITDSLSIQLELIESHGRCVQTGADDVFLHLKFTAEYRHGIRFRGVFLKIQSNPARLPIRIVEQSHFPEGGSAPIRGAAQIVRDAHLPVVAGGKAQST